MAKVVPRFSKIAGAAMTPGRADLFLEAIATGSEDSEAAEYAGLTLSTVYKHRRANEEFRAAYKIARENRIEVYRREAVRRATEGTLRPVFHRGEQVGTIREFSDRLLEVLLKAEDPDTFGDRKVVEIAVSPMTGNDIQRALAAGNRPDLVAALELVAGAISDAADIELAQSPDDPDSYEEQK